MWLGIIGLLSSPERARGIESWVEQITDDIKQVEGVKGVFLLGPQGQLLYPSGPNAQSLATPISDVSLDIRQSLTIFELTGNPIEELKLNYAGGVLLVYDRLGLQVKTPQGTVPACLVVQCSKNINRPHLRMVMKVAMTKVQNHQKPTRGRLNTPNDKHASLDRVELDPDLQKLLDKARGV